MLPSTHESLFAQLNDPAKAAAGWDTFVRRYRPVIHGWCLRRGLHTADADDLTQTVLVSLLDTLMRYAHDPDRGRFRSWLKTVVTNAITDHARAQALRPVTSEAPNRIDARLDRLTGEEASAAEIEALAALDPVLVGVCERARARVLPKTWEAFVRRTAHQAQAELVAADLGMTEAAVYQAEYRVGKLLREEYAKCMATQTGPPLTIPENHP